MSAGQENKNSPLIDPDRKPGDQKPNRDHRGNGGDWGSGDRAWSGDRKSKSLPL